MIIKHLKLKNYRNYDDLDIVLDHKLNIFIGNNAQGKSNILESIFVLALTKSYLNVKDQNLIKDGRDFADVKADFFSDNVELKSEVILTDGAKRLKLNGNEIKRYSDYVSRIRVLIFSPYNVNFIKDGPHIRRKSINIVMSQWTNSYVKLLQNYNMILKKRNQFLKSIGDFKQEDSFYINVLNERFGLLAVDIVSQRHQFVQQINQVLPKIYQEIMNDDKLEFRYISNVSYEEERSVMLDTFKKKLEGSFSREKQYGMTLIGPHRDDFAFFLKGKDLSIYGSQGQIRAAILALKLAELAIFKDKDADYPILLLDDIFSELDVEKRNRLVKYILDDVQTIITTTDIDMIDQSLVQQAKVFHVCGGKIVDDGKRECKDE